MDKGNLIAGIGYSTGALLTSAIAVGLSVIAAKAIKSDAKHSRFPESDTVLASSGLILGAGIGANGFSAFVYTSKAIECFRHLKK